MSVNITFGWFVDLLIISLLVMAGMGMFYIIKNILMFFVDKSRW